MIDQTPEFPRKAVLCAVQLPDVSDTDFRESLDELGRLARTMGLQVVGEVTQRRGSFDPGTYLGPGKVQDLTALVNADPGNIVVLADHEITPSQARNLEKATSAAAVLDRTAVILEIFNRHARSRQARLQVEIVRLAYMAPRLREAGKGRDRQRGGIGGKGAGESDIELDRRKLRDRIAEMREELDAIAQEQKTQRSRRQSLRRVALCGYTNAGKSTLFHALTASDVYIADKLFATLDTTVRALSPEARPRILISDTIGFIRNLPTKLVASFKTTLDEALEASLILHVVDSADPAGSRHMETTRTVLSEIGAADTPEIVVYNKIDKLAPAACAALLDGLPAGVVAVSARLPEDVARLRQVIIDFFETQMEETELVVPYDRQALRNDIYRECHVLAESFDEAGVRFALRGDPATVARLRQQLALTGA